MLMVKGCTMESTEENMMVVGFTMFRRERGESSFLINVFTKDLMCKE